MLNVLTCSSASVLSCSREHMPHNNEELEDIPPLPQPEKSFTPPEKMSPVPTEEGRVEYAPVKETEKKPEEKEGFIDEAIEGLKRALRQPKKKKQTTVPQVRDEITVNIEKIMEEGLADAFRALSPIEQQEFKIKGEETARAIRLSLKSAHVKVKKIFRLLLEWLKMLPGINKFFLEQEAKIKADRIIGLKQHDQKR